MLKILIDKNTFIIYSTGKIMYCCKQLDLNVIKKLCEQLYNDGIIYKVENINDIERITKTCVFTYNINQFIIDELSKIYPTTNKRSFKNCTTISVYNGIKKFNYKLHKNGSILTSYGHFDNFFITFKMLLTSINDIKSKHHIYDINNL